MMVPDVAYWIGLVQSDGYFDRKRNVLKLEVKNVELINQFQKISKSYFGRFGKMFKITRDTRITWASTIGTSRILGVFDELDVNFGDPPIPPIWVMSDIACFSAYLAGIIDGDGNVQVKRPKYPQCLVRISSSKKQDALKECIEKMFGCKAYLIPVEKVNYPSKKKSKWWVCGFYISSKNFHLIRSFLTPWIILDYKRFAIIDFMNINFAGVA